MGKQRRRARSSKPSVESVASQCLQSLMSATEYMLPMITDEIRINDFGEIDFVVTTELRTAYVVKINFYADQKHSDGKTIQNTLYNAKLLGKLVRPLLPLLKEYTSFRLVFTQDDPNLQASPSDAISTSFPVLRNIGIGR
jgi:hypothetical protein